jgi:hypothetical protein
MIHRQGVFGTLFFIDLGHHVTESQKGAPLKLGHCGIVLIFEEILR